MSEKNKKRKTREELIKEFKERFPESKNSRKLTQQEIEEQVEKFIAPLRNIHIPRNPWDEPEKDKKQ